MPKEITDIKKFLNIAKPEEKAAAGGAKKPVTKKVLIIKHGKKVTKFKLRGLKYLYTFKTTDKEKAGKLTQSLPPGLERIEIKSKKVLAKKRRN